eukprot:CAMPEP_0114555308 /NCGR_PEP_ID=MMETSP0114-20121206/8680_1 /TAXON_ID=31324 /ORGANISM="Goniomonas sp, Strain m" /LENGTH=703 /DNA_ID=CAMNT_0001740425 /DNA_START=51 /DNA_END=2162 /DNA_ORIENTATION=-
MQWKAILCCVDVGVLFVALCFERFPPEVVTLCALLVLWFAGVVQSKDALAGFSNSALITVTALFVVVEAAQKVSWLPRLVKRFFGQNTHPRWSVFKQMCFIGTLSAFLNNTPLVAFFTPIVKDWARSNGSPASKFLIPVSYAAILGGQLTIIGTSTTLVVQGLLAQSGLPLMGFFEPALLALPCCILGFLLQATVGYYLLPDHKGGLFRHAKEHASEFLTEMILNDDSKLLGQRIQLKLSNLFAGKAQAIKLLRAKNSTPDTDSLYTGDVFLHSDLPACDTTFKSPTSAISDLGSPNAVGGVRLRIASDRDQAAGVVPGDDDVLTSLEEARPQTEPETELLQLGGDVLNERAVKVAAREEENMYHIISPIPNEERFTAGDRLILAVRPEALLNAALETSGAKFVDLDVNELRGLMHQSYEVVLASDNPFVGRPAAVAFTEMCRKYECAVLALRRNGETITVGGSDSLTDLRLQTGDTVLVVGKATFFEDWMPSRDFYVISAIGEPRVPDNKWQYGTVVILVAMFVVGGGGIVPMDQVAMGAAALNVALGFMSSKEAIASIQWNLVILIGSSLGIGRAMEVSGLAKDIANLLAQSNLSPHGLLFLLYFVVLAMTEVVSNNSAAALTYPIAISVAKTLGLNAMPFVMAVVFAASCGFAVPIGYQCHLMVMGPGGYDFKDFVKIGVILDILCMGIVAGFAPVIWPF